MSRYRLSQVLPYQIVYQSFIPMNSIITTSLRLSDCLIYYSTSLCFYQTVVSTIIIYILLSATPGYLFSSPDNPSQTISIGYTPPIVQPKEFLYSFLPASDGMIGSVFYFTVTPHAIHVFLGIHRLTIIYIIY